MILSQEKKLELIRSLNWDYDVSPEDMLSVIEGKPGTAAPFDRKFLFVRSLERLPWHYMIGLWGVETAKELYTPEIARRLWPKSRRETAKSQANYRRNRNSSFNISIRLNTFGHTS